MATITILLSGLRQSPVSLDFSFFQTFAANLPELFSRFEALEIGVHLYLESWFTCMFAKVRAW
jgi:hypothetical protein